MEKMIPKQYPNSRPNDGYHKLESAMNDRFNQVGESGELMFTTDISNHTLPNGCETLYEYYVSLLPEEAQQHYRCNACAGFINKYGKLVTIDSATGKTESVAFTIDETIDIGIFRSVINACKQLVEKANVTGVFKTGKDYLGNNETDYWSHLHVEKTRGWNKVKTYGDAGLEMYQYRESFGLLMKFLSETPMDVIEAACQYVYSDQLYRGDRVEEQCEFLYRVAKVYHKTQDSSIIKTNVIRKIVCENPAGMSHIKSSMLGTLIEDIQKGLSSDIIIANFKAKMDPETYMRTSSAPSQYQIDEAEKAVTEMGYAESLARTFALFDQLPVDEFIWFQRECEKEPVKEAEPTKPKAGLFDSIRSKESVKKEEKSLSKDDISVNIPPTVMTWDKFKNTVLPHTVALYTKMNKPGNLVAMTTRQNSKSKNILKWDNPFAWCYKSGADASIKERVVNAGGQYDNVLIRASLMWDGPTDLDLHCILHCNGILKYSNNHIQYSNKCGAHGITLDVDANGGRVTTLSPVENIVVPTRYPITSTEQIDFFVHNYQPRSLNGLMEQVPYVVELQVGTNIYRYAGIASCDNKYLSQVIRISFPDETLSGANIRIIAEDKFKGELCLDYSANNGSWNIEDEFAKVHGIIPSPNTWGGNTTTNGNHTFFLLDGCKPENGNGLCGFLSEMLNSDLLPYRRVLDQYVAAQTMEVPLNELACGLGFSATNPWNLTLRAHLDDGTTRYYKIDRFD